jgi:uncharacterized membrane protein YbhN (UPF0104 family)
MSLPRRALAVITSPGGRVVGTVVLLGVVAANIDWRLVEDRLHSGRWEWFAAAVALVASALVIGAVRWHRLLHGADVPAPPYDTARAYAIGVFSNNFLPTAFGGDAARALIVGRSGKPLMRSSTTVVADRLSALVCLVLVGWLLLGLDPGAVPGELAGGLALVTAAVAAGALVLFLAARSRLARPLLPSFVKPLGSEAVAVLRGYAADRRLLLEVLLLGIGYQVLIVCSVWFLSKAIAVDVPLALLAVVLPIVLVVTLVPISIAGFGLREGAFVVLLSRAGVESADAALLSLLTVAALAIASLPGGVALMLRSKGRAHQAPQA